MARVLGIGFTFMIDSRYHNEGLLNPPAMIGFGGLREWKREFYGSEGGPLDLDVEFCGLSIGENKKPMTKSQPTCSFIGH